MGPETREPCQKARNIVYRLLKFRARSEQEIRQRLLRHRIPKDVIEETVTYLRSVGIIDDEAFVRSWIRARSRKPFGYKKILAELKQKGVDDSLIRGIMDPQTLFEDEEDVVRHLAAERARRYRGLDRTTLQRRMYGYLTRRGFRSSVIKKIIREL